jgi:hypothetical protein
MGDRQFGEIPPYRPAVTFASRKELARSRLHGPPEHAISGSSEKLRTRFLVSGDGTDRAAIERRRADKWP